MIYKLHCEKYGDEPMWYLYEYEGKRKIRLVECFKLREQAFKFAKANNITIEERKRK